MKNPQPLTWLDLALKYNEAHTGRQAQTLPFQTIWDWAARQTETFYIDPTSEKIYLKRK